MNHLIVLVSLAGILSTAVVFGTDMFFFDCGPSRSQIGFAICWNGGYGIYPCFR